MGRKNQAIHFAVCLNNEGYKASLKVGKLYQIIPDVEAAKHGYFALLMKAAKTTPSRQIAFIK
jgi:hypothetical protein